MCYICNCALNHLVKALSFYQKCFMYKCINTLCIWYVNWELCVPKSCSQLPPTISLPSLVVNVFVLADEVCTFRKAPNFYRSFPELTLADQHLHTYVRTRTHKRVPVLAWIHTHTWEHVHTKVHNNIRQGDSLFFHWVQDGSLLNEKTTDVIFIRGY